MIYITTSFPISILTNTTHKLEAQKVKKREIEELQKRSLVGDKQIVYAVNSQELTEELQSEDKILLKDIKLQRGDILYTITSDHGRHNDSEPDLAGTPIFMIKRSNTTGSELKISDVPVYHEDIQATLLDCAGLYEQNEDEQIFGRSVFDLKEGELRERTWYDRRYDSDFKSVKTLGSVQFAWSGCNTYYGYSYIGNTDVLADMVSSGNVTNIYQMTDNKG